ncbi:MAG: FAD-dependent oxidoreductase [Rhodobacteraceae bacterium]|nr:FAD-dependent oxidoreductase [Paracoccaceae bacterium]
MSASSSSARIPSVDVAIVGGGAIGAAVAWGLRVLAGFEGSVAVIERDASYAGASVALNAGGIRAQFSTAVNIALSAYGVEVLRAFPDLFGASFGGGAARPDPGFHEHGYLFLAATPAQEAAMRATHAAQRAAGAEVALLTPAEVAARYPHLRLEDIRLASLGLRGEGWFDNMGLHGAMLRAARAAGARVIRDEAVGFEMTADRGKGGRVAAVRLASGARLGCGVAVNAAGPRAGTVAGWAGLSLPVEPRKRTLFTFDCAAPPAGPLPLMIDPSGVFCRPEGTGFLAGAPPVEDPAVAPEDFEPRHAEFEDIVWPTLAARAECFEAIRPGRFWAGHYEWNRFDRNGVVGAHPEVPNLIHAAGFSGHGLQHAPGVGRGVGELIAHGAYRSLDLSPLGYERLLENRPLVEEEVI